MYIDYYRQHSAQGYRPAEGSLAMAFLLSDLRGLCDYVCNFRSLSSEWH